MLKRSIRKELIMSMKMRVKEISVFLVVLMVMLSMFAGCSKEKAPAADQASEPEPEVIELGWAQPQPEGHPWTDYGQKICNEVFEESGGRIKITQYPAGGMGSEAETINMLRSGSLAFTTSGPTILNSFYGPSQIFAFPYLFEDKDQAYQVFTGPIGQRVYNDIILKASNVRALDFWYYGTRVLTINGVKPNKPEDLKGFKVRCMDNPVAKNVIGSLGASPVPVSLAELYMALQTGVVQGQENPLPTIYAQKFHEVQDYIVFTNHSVHTGIVYVSEQIWQSLSDADRELITRVFKRNKPLIDKAIEDEADRVLEEMKERGIELVYPDLKAFQEYSKNYILEQYKDQKDWMDLYQEVINAK
jgi:tripartite ATP-independent transporter DctP family solute receptor